MVTTVSIDCSMVGLAWRRHDKAPDVQITDPSAAQRQAVSFQCRECDLPGLQPFALTNTSGISFKIASAVAAGTPHMDVSLDRCMILLACYF